MAQKIAEKSQKIAEQPRNITSNVPNDCRKSQTISNVPIDSHKESWSITAGLLTCLLACLLAYLLPSLKSFFSPTMRVQLSNMSGWLNAFLHLTRSSAKEVNNRILLRSLLTSNVVKTIFSFRGPEGIATIYFESWYVILHITCTVEKKENIVIILSAMEIQ